MVLILIIATLFTIKVNESTNKPLTPEQQENIRRQQETFMDRQRY